MSNEFEKHAANIANSSGFPLQIRIANIAGSPLSKWKVLLEEHPWHSHETGSEGFLDIVLLKSSVNSRDVLVIECKRVKQTKWVFLIPKLNPKPILFTRARLWKSRHTDSGWNRFDWVDMQTEPRSYESQFCAIPGQEHGHRNLLERTSAELIQATEALAVQERELFEKRRIAESGAYLSMKVNTRYIPVIVTTAELIISFFEPESISLKDGFLPSDSVFETVPVVRFRKSLAASPVGYLRGQNIQEMHAFSERTVFIVNAEGFQSFLTEWGFIDNC